MDTLDTPDTQIDPDDAPDPDLVDGASDPRRQRTRSGVRLKVLFAVAAWGLGHATRDLPLIDRLLSLGCELTIVSTDRALALLRHELAGRCEFLEWPDLPIGLARSKPLYYAKYALTLPRAMRAVMAEYRALQQLLRVRPFDRVISDNRWGMHSPRVKSFQISHGLRFIAPRRNRALELLMEFIYYRSYGDVGRFLVPDFASNSLSGELSRGTRFIDRSRISYVGILSGIRRRDPRPDVESSVDCFISISGPEPQRTIFEEIALAQAHEIPGRVIVGLGKPEEAGRHRTAGRVEIYHYVDRPLQEHLMNEAKVIVSRSGYTTLMELAELGKPALLIPTPGQTEQEYLATMHSQLGHYASVTQDRLSLARDVEAAARYRGYRPAHRTAESVERVLDVVLDG